MPFVIVFEISRRGFGPIGRWCGRLPSPAPGEPVYLRAERRRRPRRSRHAQLVGYLKRGTRPDSCGNGCRVGGAATVGRRNRCAKEWCSGKSAMRTSAAPRFWRSGKTAARRSSFSRKSAISNRSIDFFAAGPRRRAASPKLLGSELARMHEAGFYHPDLFAKHVLVGQADGLDRVCLHRLAADAAAGQHRLVAKRSSIWPRSTPRSPRSAVAPRERLRLLASYLHHFRTRARLVNLLIAAIRGRASVASAINAASIDNMSPACDRFQTMPGPRDWHGWHNCPLRLTDPSLAVLPLVNYLRGPADLELRRRRLTLRQAGRALRDLHETGYVPADLGLENWVGACSRDRRSRDSADQRRRSDADHRPARPPGD